jgi:hypothetical protein
MADNEQARRVLDKLCDQARRWRSLADLFTHLDQERPGANLDDEEILAVLERVIKAQAAAARRERERATVEDRLNRLESQIGSPLLKELVVQLDATGAVFERRLASFRHETETVTDELDRRVTELERIERSR